MNFSWRKPKVDESIAIPYIKAMLTLIEWMKTEKNLENLELYLECVICNANNANKLLGVKEVVTKESMWKIVNEKIK